MTSINLSSNQPVIPSNARDLGFSVQRIKAGRRTYAAIAVGDEVAFRTASDSITRVTPLMIMLTPTRTPIAHAELDGHCR
jgi:hypothetical protein